MTQLVNNRLYKVGDCHIGLRQLNDKPLSNTITRVQNSVDSKGIIGRLNVYAMHTYMREGRTASYCRINRQ